MKQQRRGEAGLHVVVCVDGPYPRAAKIELRGEPHRVLSAPFEVTDVNLTQRLRAAATKAAEEAAKAAEEAAARSGAGIRRESDGDGEGG